MVETAQVRLDAPAVAEALIAAADPAAAIGALAPYNPIELLVALHGHVTASLLRDLAHARRVAAIAALVAARHPDDALAQAQHHWTQGAAVTYVPDHPRALAHYDAALDWYERARAQLAPAEPARDVRVVQIMRVFCLTELGRYGEAQAAVAAAAAWLAGHPHDLAELTLRLNRSQLAGSMGDFEQMVEHADATVALAERLGQTARMAQGLINRGLACTVLGRYAEAEAALERGCALAEAAGEPVTAARGMWNRARLLRSRGQLFAALQMLQRASAGLAQASGEAATVAMEEAMIALRLRQMPEAARAARRAADEYWEQGLPIYSAQAMLSLAQIAVARGHGRAAQQALAQAARRARPAGLPTLHAEIAAVTAAAAALQPGPAQAQARAARRAVATLRGAGFAQAAAEAELAYAALAARSDPAQARAVYRQLLGNPSVEVRLAAHAGLAGLLPVAAALPHLRAAARLSAGMRRSLPMEELQARFSSETSPHHQALARAYLALDDPAAALAAVWAGRAEPILDLRAARGDLPGPGMAALDEARARLASWRERRFAHYQQARDALGMGQVERADHHTRRADEAAAAARHVERELSAALRSLGGRSGQAALPDLAAVQAALPGAGALLEYVYDGAELGCFLLRPGRAPAYRRLADSVAVAALVDRWALVVRRRPPDQAAAGEVLAGLWQALIAPWEPELAEVAELLVAPAGVTCHVPWAALAPGAGPALAERWALALTPSGGLLAGAPAPAAAPVGPPRLIGYASSGERYLPGVAAELDAVAASLPAAELRLPASSADLRARAAPRILHIAAHASTNSDAPLCSAIELADGPFMLVEAHRLDLRGTALVTLSACETGVQPDEGVVALALVGAFMCAGAAAVVASLWAVDDAVTADLMAHFYAELAAGRPAPRALAAAQQAVRGRGSIDWSAFQIWAGARPDMLGGANERP